MFETMCMCVICVLDVRVCLCVRVCLRKSVRNFCLSFKMQPICNKGTCCLHTAGEAFQHVQVLW